MARRRREGADGTRERKHRWLGLPLRRVARPNVEAWMARIMSRPACDGVLTLPIV